MIRKPDHVMKPLLLLLFILVSDPGLWAQDSMLVTIKAGNRVKDVLSPSEIYYYPQFTNGKVFLRDGSRAGAKMNYSRTYDQMLFIGPGGDTLAWQMKKPLNSLSLIRTRCTMMKDM